MWGLLRRLFLICFASLHDRSGIPGLNGLRDEDAVPTMARNRSTTPMSTLSLDKPLPSLPAVPSWFSSDVNIHAFEGYLDMLAYSQRGLPPEPMTVTDAERKPSSRSASPGRMVIMPAPKEDEWMSTRSESQMSSANTTSASGDEARRRRSRTSTLARSNSASGKSVTPMSSLESDSEPRGTKRTLSGPGPGMAPRIEEVSEPGTASPTLTPQRQSTAAPQICYYCGRDPSGKDAKRRSGSPMTVLEISRLLGQNGKEPREDTGAPGTAHDGHRRHSGDVFDSETCHLKALEGKDEVEENLPRTPEPGAAFDHTDYVRPANPDPYASTFSSPDELPQGRKLAEVEIEIEDEGKSINDLECSTPSQGPAKRSFYDRVKSSAFQTSPSNGHENSQDVEDEQEPGAESLHTTSFWKDPGGVILVYQGIDVEGEELYYGSDINFLGSFRDDDEGSSDLGSTRNSTHDLVGTGEGLAMIPEVVGGSDELWDDEAFEA